MTKKGRLLLTSFVMFVFVTAYSEVNLQTPKAIEQRVKPIGQVEVKETNTSSETEKSMLSGKEIYEKYCTVCHSSGAAGAPKFGDKSAWKPRIAQGKDILYQHAIQGFKMMPPKGTCLACSDEDIKKAVDYILLEHS